MLKIRIQGTEQEIKWFHRFLGKKKEVEVTEISAMYKNKGTDKFRRNYVEINRMK